MSHVTDTFLMTSVLFDPKDNPQHAATLRNINEWLDARAGGQRFKRLNDNFKVYGGRKKFQASIWCGAFNYLPLYAFVSFLKTLNFNGWAQLVYQEENDEGFTLVQIAEESA